MGTLPIAEQVIRAARVVCPATGLDEPGCVAFCGDRIVAVRSASDAGGSSSPVCEFPEGMLLPGLIDLHAHPARSGSIWGVEPDAHCLARGTTTVLSQGDAGAANADAYVEETIARSRTRVRLALNLSSRGEAGPGSCLGRLELADVAACVAAAQRLALHVWGLAVNVSHHCCGATDPREVLRRGLAAASEIGLPILFGMRRPRDWPLADQLALLRPGDVVTYCFRREPHCIVERGRVMSCVREARARGILFDVGHGTASFDFETAEAALADGFPPDTISTDLQRNHLGGLPVHDLPLVVSKLCAAGMPEPDAWAAATIRPARVLRLEREIGALRPGAIADLTVLVRQEDAVALEDSHGNRRIGTLWTPVATLRAGQWAAAPSAAAG